MEEGDRDVSVRFAPRGFQPPVRPASRQVVQAKVGIAFELRDLPVGEADPIVDVTVAATRPAISAETKDTVLGRQGLDSIPKGSVLRHVIPYDTLVQRLEGGLIGKTSDEALTWLWKTAPLGTGHTLSTRTFNTISRQAPTNRHKVETQALDWLKKWQNHPANLFIGTSAENASLSNAYDNPSTADSGEHRQKFKQENAVHQVAEFADRDRPDFGPAHWFSDRAEQGFRGKIASEGATLEPREIEGGFIEWLLGSPETGSLGVQIARHLAELRDTVPWQSLTETLILLTRGRPDQLGSFMEAAWARYGNGIRAALGQLSSSGVLSGNQSVQLKPLPCSILPPAPRAAFAEEPASSVVIGFGRLPVGGPPCLVQRKEGVDVSYELKTQPVDPHAPITAVTVSGARPPIRNQTKETVLARYTWKQHQEMLSQGTSLNRGYVWRHIIPYATLATRLEAGLEGKNPGEADQWLTDNRPLGAPPETLPSNPLSSVTYLETRAHSWLDGWQNNPLNLFVGSAEENSSLKDVYDDPRTADRGVYAQQHQDSFQNALTYADALSVGADPVPANRDSSRFFAQGALEDLEEQTRSDQQPAFERTKVEEEMYNLLAKRKDESLAAAEIFEASRKDEQKLRATTGWQSLADLYVKWSKGRKEVDESGRIFDELWSLWWPRFEGSILQAMRSRRLGESTGLIPLGRLKQSGGKRKDRPENTKAGSSKSGQTKKKLDLQEPKKKKLLEGDQGN